jgi:hypothetical protein
MAFLLSFDRNISYFTVKHETSAGPSSGLMSVRYRQP